MNSKLNQVDVLLWGCAMLLSLVLVGAMYAFHLTGPVKAIVWLGWLVSVLALGYFTTQGQEFVIFASEAKLELQKVVWPTRQETIQTTSIVMIMVVVAGFVLWAVDVGMMWLIGKITHLG
jgi:preprotein translocase subunit SecE